MSSSNPAETLLSGLLSADAVALIDEVAALVPDRAFTDPTLQALYGHVREYRRRAGGVLSRAALLDLAGGTDAGTAALLRETYDVLAADRPDDVATRWAADRLREQHRATQVRGLLADATEIARATPDRPVRDDGGRMIGHGPDDAVKWISDRAAEYAAESGTTSANRLTAVSVADLRARVAARGPRQYLLRGMWPEATYGVLGAEAKAQKTWAAVDMAVSVASGTPWLGHVPVDAPGPVLMFAGEGGDGGILRRIDAVAAARDVDPDCLPVSIVGRAPHLTDPAHVTQLRAMVADVRPALVIVDPLYLAAQGADLRDLYAMGRVLETVQHVCADVGAALLVVHHHNRGQGSGASRLSGAGPAEWGRVLISAEVKSRHADREHARGSDVVTILSVIGGEVPEQSLRVRRRIWADDPDDLDSPLHVVTETTDAAEEFTEDGAADAEGRKLSPAARSFLDALRKIGREATGPEINDEIAAGPFGNGLKAPTMSKAGAALVAAGLVVGTSGPDRFSPKRWRLTEWPASVTESPVVTLAVTDGDDPVLSGLVPVSTVSTVAKPWQPSDGNPAGCPVSTVAIRRDGNPETATDEGNRGKIDKPGAMETEGPGSTGAGTAPGTDTDRDADGGALSMLTALGIPVGAAS